jgi:hypothetical protein
LDLRAGFQMAEKPIKIDPRIVNQMLDMLVCLETG